ncbi:hypothetical protein [Longimicrobium terrae]|uniref:hypothetical protein n=1 Tax=Longimicrobium terrae TaxID=1639882 RepID=UPI00147309A7|nr:hypothetical protein [Longimicrobium terrae]NNC28152.1 hypothetical protein [Longimicrobium terrae]
MTAAEYEVYSALLGGDWRDTSYVVVEDETEDRAMRVGRERMKRAGELGVSDSVIADYDRLNARNHRLHNAFASRERVRMAGPRELNALFSAQPAVPDEIDSRWLGFRARYPGATGVVRFSRVAFADSGNTAIVSVSHGCGGLCGAGGLLRMERRDGVWKVTTATAQWIS